MERELREYVTKILLELGFNTRYLGFQYVRDSIIYLALNSSDFVANITASKSIYPCVANKYGINQRRVERCILYCLNNAYLKGNIEEWEKIFGSAASKNADSPTSMQFIKRIAGIVIEDTKRSKKEKKEKSNIYYIDFQRMRM